jgi:hypothetical protein
VSSENLSENSLRIDVLAEKLLDADTPGYLVECQPDEAEEMGAFEESALDVDEAIEASFDNPVPAAN